MLSNGKIAGRFSRRCLPPSSRSSRRLPRWAPKSAESAAEHLELRRLRPPWACDSAVPAGQHQRCVVVQGGRLVHEHLDDETPYLLGFRQAGLRSPLDVVDEAGETEELPVRRARFCDTVRVHHDGVAGFELILVRVAFGTRDT